MRNAEQFWWRPVPQLPAVDALVLEVAAGADKRFADVDALAGRVLQAALQGEITAAVTPGPAGIKDSDTLTVPGLSEQERAFVEQTYAASAQQERGAWYLPERAVIKAGAVNLPGLVRRRPGHAVTLAGDDAARLRLAGQADAVLLWALLIPLFETLVEPIRLRAAGPEGTPAEQQALWAGIEARYEALGVDADAALARFRFGGGWGRLDRAGQQEARIRLLDVLAQMDPVALAARHRMLCLQAMVSAFAKKAKDGTPLARKVLTRALQPVLSAYFGGDWLSALDYLQAPPNPAEEIITTLPEPRLYVGVSAQAASVAAEQGLPVDEVHAMLAAFLGQPTSLSPVEERVTALQRWWRAFDEVHTRQAPGMRPLWGLVDEGTVMSVNAQGPIPRLYRDVLPGEVTAEVDRLWEAVTLPRWPKNIVTQPHPHKLMAQAFGPAAEFWHGVALTAWYLCEGPYSRTSVEGLPDYYHRQLAALSALATPIDQTLFKDLQAAEHLLGPEQPIYETDDGTTTEDDQFTFTIRNSIGTRRDGFHHLRDIITRHRRAWAETHLDSYLDSRWRTALHDVARTFHRTVATKGKPPTLVQFAKFGSEAANHWCGGDLSALYTALGERCPASQQRVRLLPGDAYAFAQTVFTGLGGQPIEYDTAAHQPDLYHRLWAVFRLTAESLRYVQLHEALGEPPTAQQFGAHRLTWPWDGGEEEGWPAYQALLASLCTTPNSPQAPLVPEPPVATRPEGASTPIPAPAGSLPVETVLTTGQDILLGSAAAVGSISTTLTYRGAETDLSILLLDESGRVPDDKHFVFYNQTTTADDTVRLHPPEPVSASRRQTATIDLSRLPASIHRILLCLSHDTVQNHETPADLAIIVTCDGKTWKLTPDPSRFPSCLSIINITRSSNHTQWQLHVLDQHWPGGLAQLARVHGITID
ncbi:TerD family protein [Streptomyces sp. ME02-6991-2B]|nr:TerD family protein [Streptomyces sp. ME02-6991-2B]